MCENNFEAYSLEWYECPACDGSGIHAYRITVYEHGCGFPHDDTAEEPCGNCSGDGGKWSDGGNPFWMGR